MTEPDKREARIARMASKLVSDLFDRLSDGGLVDEVALAEAEETAIEIVKHRLSGLDFGDIWWEFLNDDGGIAHCGLCGNHGIIDTKKSNVCTPGGIPVGIRAYCVCPNGRAAKAGAGMEPGASSIISPPKLDGPECGKDHVTAAHAWTCRRPKGHESDCSMWPRPGEPGSPWGPDGKASGPFPNYGERHEDDV